MKKYQFVFLCTTQGKDIRQTVSIDGACFSSAYEAATEQAVSNFGTRNISLESFSASNI